MSITVGELRELLEEASDDEQIVLLATQPSWPLAFQVGGVWNQALAGEYDSEPCDEHDAAGCDECCSPCKAHGVKGCEEPTCLMPFWIVEGGHPSEYSEGPHTSPYAPKGAWES